MNKKKEGPFINHLQQKFTQLVDEYNLKQIEINVKAALLSPDDAIGATKRKDYVILKGKERLMQACIMGCRGQAFTSSQGDFTGTLEEVLKMPLTNDFQRAVYISTLNAVSCYTGKVDKTIHCRNDKLEICAQKVVEYFKKNYNNPRILMIGYQPALAEALFNEGFSLIVLDLDPANIDQTKNGVNIRNGAVELNEYIAESDVIFATSSTICNATIDTLYNAAIPLILFGTSGSGAAKLMGINRFCPEATCGRCD